MRHFPFKELVSVNLHFQPDVLIIGPILQIRKLKLRRANQVLEAILLGSG